MANPTTNYSFAMPTNTDLVKDLPADFDIFGQAVDDRIKALNPETTAGDISYRGSTANAKTRLAIGTAGQVLTVNSGATAPEWATVSAGGMTLLSTTTLTGASVSLSSIPQTYKNLQLIVRNFLPATDAAYLTVRVNGDSTANRYRITRSNSANNAGDDSLSFDRTDWLGAYVDNSVSQGLQIFNIFDYTNTTTWKYHTLFAMGNNFTTNTNISFTTGVGAYNQTGAITSLDLQPNTGNFTSGTALLYGVS